MSEQSPPPPEKPPADVPRRFFRWQALFHRTANPLFVLDRRRRLIFANTACEQLTGLSLEGLRGLLCRRPRPAGPDDPLEDVLAHTFTPPPEALHGQFCRTRRLFVPRSPAGSASGPQWWDVEFFPLRQPDPPGYLLVGRVLPVPADSFPTAQMLPERLEALRLGRVSRYTFDLAAGTGPAMQRLAQQVRLASQVRVPVLLVGEPGTGKATLARVIHYQGPSRERALAALDCARLPPSAVADVLLADRTGPLWSGLGALYLADPGHLPRDLQLRLCEWLAAPGDSPDAPRLLAGVRGDPAVEVQAGRLVEELHWRLATLVLEVPPLRNRLEDLPRLIERLFTEGATPEAGPPPLLSAAAREAFHAHSWPGNLTELRRVLESARRRTTSGTIDLADLPFTLRQARQLALEPARPAPTTLLLEETLAEVERRLIGLALARTRGNRSRAAELLGIHRPRLLRRMEALGLGAPPAADESD